MSNPKNPFRDSSYYYYNPVYLMPTLGKNRPIIALLLGVLIILGLSFWLTCFWNFYTLKAVNEVCDPSVVFLD